MIPLTLMGDLFTSIYFYPVYSPSHFSISLEIYDASGKCLAEIPRFLSLHSPVEELKWIDFKAVCASLKIPITQEMGARIIAVPEENRSVPARIKLGLDLGHEKRKHMPCNICTNLQPHSPQLDTKPSTFRWLPILADQSSSSFWIMNSSPAVHYEKEAQIQLNFYREQDTETLARSILLPPQGFTVIRTEEEQELQNFFNGKPGWCTAISSNPYTVTYYFTDSASGVVGGDHGF
jgi:hypothetical protein